MREDKKHMNLISCESCGVVLDKSNLKFPKDIHRDDGSVDLEKGAWDNEDYDYVPFVKCPVCGDIVLARA